MDCYCLIMFKYKSASLIMLIMEKEAKPSIFYKIWNILFLGLLSTFFAEVYSGSSPFWFLEPWGWLMTFPLYLTHALFYLNVAIKTKRTTLRQLYWFGALFGLYEGLITRVLWFGYPGEEGPIFGSIGGIGGIAILEYLTLIFFWHPIFAFILPVLIYEFLSINTRSDLKGIYNSHLPWLKKSKHNMFFFASLTIMGSIFLSLSVGFDFFAVFVAISGSAAIVSITLFVCKKNNYQFEIRTLELKQKGFIILVIYMILALYIPMWFLLDIQLPRPNIWGVILYILSFILFIVLLKLTPPEENDFSLNSEEKRDNSVEMDQAPKNFTYLTLIFSWVIICLLSILYAFTNLFILVIATLLFLSMPVIGIILFSFSLYKNFKKVD